MRLPAALVIMPMVYATIDATKPMRIAQPQPVFRKLSRSSHRSLRARVIPAAMVIVALSCAEEYSRDHGWYHALITGPWTAGPSARSRGSRIGAKNIAEPAQKMPKTMCNMRKMTNSSFNGWFLFAPLLVHQIVAGRRQFTIFHSSSLPLGAV